MSALVYGKMTPTCDKCGGTGEYTEPTPADIELRRCTSACTKDGSGYTFANCPDGLGDAMLRALGEWTLAEQFVNDEHAAGGYWRAVLEIEQLDILAETEATGSSWDWGRSREAAQHLRTLRAKYEQKELDTWGAIRRTQADVARFLYAARGGKLPDKCPEIDRQFERTRQDIRAIAVGTADD